MSPNIEKNCTISGVTLVICYVKQSLCQFVLETLRASDATTLVAAQDKLPSLGGPKPLAIACCATSLDAILTLWNLVHSDITSGYMHCAHLQLTCSYYPLLIIFFVLNYFTSIITAWASLILHNPQQCSNVHNDSRNALFTKLICHMSWVPKDIYCFRLQSSFFSARFGHVSVVCLSVYYKVILLLYAKVIDRYFPNYVRSYIWVVSKWSR